MMDFFCGGVVCRVRVYKLRNHGPNCTRQFIRMTNKRLIEVAFPLKQVSLDSVHEKNVRHGPKRFLMNFMMKFLGSKVG